MNFHVYDEPKAEEGGDEGEVSSHIEYALGLGDGGATVWMTLSDDANLASIEAELASVRVDKQKLHTEEDVGVAQRYIDDRLELHAWRRCFYMARRLAVMTPPPNEAVVQRFIDAVVDMQKQMTKSEGHISISGISVRAATAHQIKELFAWREQATTVPTHVIDRPSPSNPSARVR